MSGATALAVVVGDQNGARVIFANGGGTSEWETKVGENLPKICDNLPGCTSSDDFGLRRRKGGCLLDAGFRENRSAPNTNDNTLNRAVLTNA
jgi:hypothetical protein